VLRVTLDTNVYVSGLNYSGNPYEILEFARAKKMLVAVSDDILDEVKRVLQERFQWPQRRASQARRDIKAFSQHVTPTTPINAVKDDPDDNRILECAVAAGSDYIVSGDNHLLKLGHYKGIQIIRVADFLEIAQGESRKR
jgi:putative PIN family toxin of toxin-antitoxin system